MKLQKMIYGLVCLFVALMLCGCEWELASPESLITPPKSNQERLQQKQLVTSFLSREESLIVPEALNEANAYQYLDLDQNGDDEIIAFYANKESNLCWDLSFWTRARNSGI